jgi:hypothetical protein
MALVHSEEELLRCFRQLDRREVELSDELVYPIVVDEVLSWAVGPRAFLLFSDAPGRPLRGIVFHRNNGGEPDVAAMCEWCHTSLRHGGVKLMTARCDRRRSVGLYLCSNLRCVSPSVIPRIRELASRRLF